MLWWLLVSLLLLLLIHEWFEVGYKDDTLIVGLLHKDELEHGPVVDEFVKWCDVAFLQLNKDQRYGHWY